MRLLYSRCSLASLLLMLCGCATGPKFETSVFGETGILVSSSGANISTSKNVNGVEVQCIRLGPDATSDVTNDVDLVDVNRASGEDAASDDEVEMIGRTPTNVLIRDTLFHLCTLYQSQAIDKSQYFALISNVLKDGFALAKLEVTNTNIAVKSNSAGLKSAPTTPIIHGTQTPAIINTPASTANSATTPSPASLPAPPGPPPPV